MMSAPNCTIYPVLEAKFQIPAILTGDISGVDHLQTGLVDRAFYLTPLLGPWEKLASEAVKFSRYKDSSRSNQIQRLFV